MWTKIYIFYVIAFSLLACHKVTYRNISECYHLDFGTHSIGHLIYI